jgi:hypothetical protein
MHTTPHHFTCHSISLIPSEIVQYLDLEIIKSNLSKDYKFIERKCTDLDLAQEYKNLVDVANTSPSDYLNKELCIDGIWCFISLRFFGLDVNKPFIGLDFFDCSYNVLLSKWGDLKLEIFQEYEIFQPFAISICIPNSIHIDQYNLSFQYDVDLYAKPISKIVHMQSNFITIEKILQFSEQEYDKYIEEYKLFNAQKHINEFLKPEKFSDIQKWCISDKVFKVFRDKEWVGLFILEKDSTNVIHGYCVVEKLVFEKYRGNNISSIAHELILASDFDPNEKGFIFGTIYHDHRASQISAEKVGRVCVYQYLMME